MYLRIFLLVIFTTSTFIQVSKQTSCSNVGYNNHYCSSTKPKRYFLYNVQPGEGFNLRRDIYVRISPLINKLNKEDKKNHWTLVLPPWGRLPHWTSKIKTLYYWQTFFNIKKIQEFVPSIEFNEFLEEYGMDNGLDIVFQLQHYPFNSNSADWMEKMEIGVQCERKLKYHLDKETGFYVGQFWEMQIYFKKIDCMALRGQASTLLNFLLESEYRTIMFDKAEVILWDSYGEHEWWEARKSLQFSTKLFKIAEQFLNQNIPQFDKNNIMESNYFLGIHLRRQDFIFGRENEFPTITGAAFQIVKKLNILQISTVFVATDSPEEDVEKLLNEMKKLMIKSNSSSQLIFLKFNDNNNLTDGEISIVDQIICSWSKYFIGTRDSTFTLRIFEEREILGFNENATFNYFCPDEVSVPCKKPTRWKLK